MKNLLSFLSALLFTLAAQAQNSEEHFLVLPLVGYSDEQGLGLGANAAWLNMSGTSWNLSGDIFASTIYSQTHIGLDFYNRHLFDLLYIDLGGFFMRSSRSLFYGLGNKTSLDDASQYAVNDNFVFVRVGVGLIFDGLVFGVGG